jgi:hypothetical protein
VRRRHASHITVFLSKAAHSGPSVCLRARAPCPLRVSHPGADRAERAARAAGVSVQCELQVFALPRLLGSRHVGGLVYPEPAFVIVIADTLLPINAASAVACTPPAGGAEMFTVGSVA